MHFVIYLPAGFYSAIASSYAEILQAVNETEQPAPFTFEFVSSESSAVSRSGIVFPTKKKPSRKMDVLVLLAGEGSGINIMSDLLEKEALAAIPLVRLAQRQGAVLAATCGAAYHLAVAGMLDGKRATISWWLKKEAQHRFPKVKWQPARILVRHGRIYTSGGGFSGLELMSTLLTDLGYAQQERKVRKLMVLPPSRQFQSPYELELDKRLSPLELQLNKLVRLHLDTLDIGLLSRHLGMSSRTLARKFEEELHLSPGKWIQQQRLDKSKALLEDGSLTIAEICYKVGYEDPSSFTRLFAKETGMSPTDFRKQLLLG